MFDMDDKDLFKFRVKLLHATNYFLWSNDMKTVLRGKGLWRFVEDPIGELRRKDDDKIQRKET